MAEQQFNLETFLRAYMDLKKHKSWRYTGPEGYKRFWFGAVEYFLDSRNKDEKFRYSFDDMPGSVKNIIAKMENARGDSLQAKEIRDTVEFVAEQVFFPVHDGYAQYYNNTPQLQMFLKRLSEFNDTDLVYEALSFMKQNIGYIRPSENVGRQLEEKRKIVCNEIVNMMASNPNATQEDIVELIYWAKTPEEVLKVVNDVFAKTDEDLDGEMKKDVPNSERVKGILFYPRHVINVGFGDSEASYELRRFMGAKDTKACRDFIAKLTEFRKIVDDKYNFDKIVGSGDRNYISNYEDTVDTKIIELEQENERLTKENNSVVQSRDQYKANYDREKELHEKLLKNHSDLIAEKRSLESMLQSALAVIAAYETGEQNVDKAGVFNKGAAKVKMKEEIEKAQLRLKDLQQAEEARKAKVLARQKAAGEAISI